MNRFRLLAHSLWNSKWSQLAARLKLTVKRTGLVAFHGVGIGPGAWYWRGAAQIRYPVTVSGSILTHEQENQNLPLNVDLVGTPWTVHEGMDWNPSELNRGTHLEKLNLHYMLYLLKLRPQAAVQLMEDWALRVPPYLPAYWKDTWNSYSLSIRVTVWMDLLTTLPDAIESKSLRVINQSLAAQIRFLTGNMETDIGGNHLMKNIRALLRAGAYFMGSEADRWTSLAFKFLNHQLKEQILPDGMHFELSPSYHLQIFEDLLDIRRAVVIAALRTRCKIGLQAQVILHNLDNSLIKMGIVAQRMTHPDGMPSLFADGGLHMTASSKALLKKLIDLKVIKSKNMLDTTGPWRLQDAGYVGLSSENGLLVVDCGPVGARHLPAHGHGDALAIEWSILGRRVIVDSGVCEYHSGPRRAYSRSTAAHNTVTVNNVDQSEFWSAFRVGRRAHVAMEVWQPLKEGFNFQASHDGYRRLKGHPIHRRTIMASPKCIKVTDEVIGGAQQPVQSRLLLAPTARIKNITHAPTGGSRVLIVVDKHPEDLHCSDSLQLELLSSAPIRSESAQWSPDFGVLKDTLMIIIEVGCAPCSATWSIEVT